MIKQVFHVEDYWEVVIFYNVDYSLFPIIGNEIGKLGITRHSLKVLKKSMESGKAKAVTCSSLGKHRSIVLFNRHHDNIDYINSLVHEAEHIKQAMLEAYHVEDKGEPPAYTIGYLVGRMWEVFHNVVMKQTLLG